MMGRQGGDQRQLFYLFNLEDRIPAEHLLSRINPIVTAVLGDLRDKLVSFYSDIGRPSIDPELMMRMLIVGYCYGNCRSSCLQARRRVPRACGRPSNLSLQARGRVSPNRAMSRLGRVPSKYHQHYHSLFRLYDSIFSRRARTHAAPADFRQRQGCASSCPTVCGCLLRVIRRDRAAASRLASRTFAGGRRLKLSTIRGACLWDVCFVPITDTSLPSLYLRP
jgi:hypothetical protein